MPARIAVLPFENRTGDVSLDDLGRFAAEWITAGLAELDTLDPVPPSTVTAAMADGEAEPTSVARVARQVGAGLLVTGSIVQVGDSLDLHAQLLDPDEDRVLGSFDPARSARERPELAVGRLREQIAGSIAQRLDESVVGLASVKNPPPPSYDAWRAFKAGVDLFFDRRYPAAIRELDRAWAADPGFSAPGIWVASALGNTGQWARQDSVLRLLEHRRAEMSPVERAGADYMRARLRGDLEAAYRIVTRDLWQQPTTEGRVVGGGAAYSTNRPHEAVAILRSEPKRGVARNQWLGFHSTLTAALHVLGEHEEELEAAREARARLPELIEPLFLEARALIALHRVDSARAVMDEAMAHASDGSSPGYLQLRAGLELRWHGHDEAAQRALRRGLEWFTTIGSEEDDPYTVARGHFWLGELDSAARLFDELATRHPGEVAYLGYLGVALAAAGRIGAALRVDGRLEDWDEPYVRGRHLYWRAAIAAHQGETSRAMSLLRGALARGVAYSVLHENEVLRPLRDHPPFRKLLEPR